MENAQNKKGLKNLEVIGICKSLRDSMINPDFDMWTPWFKDLQGALMQEYTKVENRDKLAQLKETGGIDVEILVKVLISRAKLLVLAVKQRC